MGLLGTRSGRGLRQSAVARTLFRRSYRLIGGAAVALLSLSRLAGAGEPPVAEAGHSGWQVKPDPPAEPLIVPTDVKLEIPVGRGFDATVHCPPVPSPYVLTGVDYPYSTPKTLWDLRTGKSCGKLDVEFGLRPWVRISPDGKHVAFIGQIPSPLEVWSFERGKQMQKFEVQREGGEVVWHEFAGPDRLIICRERSTEVGVWEIASGKKLFTCPVTHGVRGRQLAISPRRHYLSVCDENGLRLVDLRNGVLAGTLKVSDVEGIRKAWPAGFAFSHDGKELAGMLHEHEVPVEPGHLVLRVWDLSDGHVIVDHPVNLGNDPKRNDLLRHGYHSIEWFDDGSGWLLFGTYMIDRQKGGPVYILPFDGQDNFPCPRRFVHGDRMLIATGQGKKRHLEFVPLPREKLAAGAKLAAAGGDVTDVDMPPVTAVNWTGMREAVELYPSEWSYVVPAAPAAVKSGPSSIALEGRSDQIETVFFSRADVGQAAVALSAADSRIVQTSVSYTPAKDVAFAVDRYDLATGKRLGRTTLPYKARVCDFSPDGTQLLLTAQGRVDVITAADGKPVVGWRPYQEERKALDVIWAAHVDPQHVLTSNYAGQLILWKLPECRAIWTVTGGGQQHPALSADRKCLAVQVRDVLHVMDTAAGRSFGRLPLGSKEDSTPSIQRPVFSADGRRLAAFLWKGGQAFMATWDLKTGDRVAEVRLPQALTNTFDPLEADKTPMPLAAHHFAWCGPQHMLVQVPATLQSGWYSRPPLAEPRRDAPTETLLVDLTRQRLVWWYVFRAGTPFWTLPDGLPSPDGRFWHVVCEPRQPPRLTAVTLPEPAEAAAIAKGPAPEPFLKPGDKVAVEIELKTEPPVGRTREQAVQELTEVATAMLTARQFVVVPKAAARLKLIMVEMKLPNLPTEAPKVPKSKLHGQLAIYESHRIVWEGYANRITDDPAPGEHPPDGMSLADYLRKRQWQEVVDELRQISLPETLYSPAMAAKLVEPAR
jgi:WD40 repeat protein